MLFSVIALSSAISSSAVLFILFVERTSIGSSPPIVLLLVIFEKFLKKSVLEFNAVALFEVESFFEFENSVLKPLATKTSFLVSFEVLTSFLVSNDVLNIFVNTTKAIPE